MLSTVDPIRVRKKKECVVLGVNESVWKIKYTIFTYLYFRMGFLSLKGLCESTKCEIKKRRYDTK